MSKHLALTCPVCKYQDFEWSKEQDENVSKGNDMISFQRIYNEKNTRTHDMYGCPECSSLFFL